MATPIPTPAHDTQHSNPSRRQISIQFIENRNRRQITFSKRRGGILKKAFELGALTGAEVLLLTVSETGHIYNIATPKFRPFIKQPKVRNLIQACLKAPHPPHINNSAPSTFLLPSPLPPSNNYAQLPAAPSSTDDSSIPGRSSISPFSDPDQPTQLIPFILTARLAHLHAYDQSIDHATVDKTLLQCPGIANFLRQVALVNGFNLDNSIGCWKIPSLTDPFSVFSITVTGSIGQIIIVSFFSHFREASDLMILRESFRFVRGSQSWLLQEWDGRYLGLYQIYFEIQYFISLGIIRLASHPIYQVQQTKNLTERLGFLQGQWLRPAI